ncbi:MAG: DHH family phosphoesterase [Solobacterium sp.]|nr:DHH family phosphoesterase [Solobacterium sp.]
MKNEAGILRRTAPWLLVACMAAAGFYAGKVSEKNRTTADRQVLLENNRYSYEKLNVAEGETIYVIGHRSPDTDTVCSAIAYARFLNMLGYDAQAAVTAPVNHETAFILKEAGVETPEELIDAAGKTIFLVDHSEYAQAAEGMEDAHIAGVIDHHGIGTVSTGHQVFYDARPMGSTASIIWLEHLNCGFNIDKTTAYLMLGAVLSDTDNLTGSATTETDRRAVKALAELAGVTNTDELYRQIHIEKLSYEGMTGLEILFDDYKEYEASGTTFGIGLVNAIDEETAAKLAEQMKEALPEGFKTKNTDLMYASVGIRENGEKIDYIVPANELSDEIFKAAFPNYDEFNGTAYIFRKGLGRKSLFVPGLTDYLGAHPHE